MSAPLATLEQTEQEADTAAASALSSTPPQSKIIIHQPPQSEIISIPDSEPIGSQKHHPTIDSDRVPPTIRSFEETIIAEPITTNQSAQVHNPDHSDYHDQRQASTSERISEGATEDITTPLEPSLSREVYHSQLLTHCQLSSAHAFISHAFISSRCSICYCTHILLFNLFLDVNFFLYVNFTCSNIV